MRSTSSQTVNRADWARSLHAQSWRWLGLLGFLLCLVPLSQAITPAAPPAGSNSVTMSWKSSASPGVTGYRVYVGTASRNYTTNVLVGNLTTATITGLASGLTNYFAVKSHDLNGLESEFSAEVSVVVGSPAVLIRDAGLGQMLLTVNGPLGSTYDILATQTFTNWVVIGSVMIGSNYSLNFTDTNAASFPMRFYRTQRILP